MTNPTKEGRAKAKAMIDAIVIENSRDPHLLDVLSDCLLRYLQEHPHKHGDRKTQANTLKMLTRIIEGVAVPLRIASE